MALVFSISFGESGCVSSATEVSFTTQGSNQLLLIELLCQLCPHYVDLYVVSDISFWLRRACFVAAIKKSLSQN